MAKPERITQPQILAAALRTVEEEGDLSLRLVARRLKVKAPAIYWRFETKDALERAVAMEGYRMLGRVTEAGTRRNHSFTAWAAAYRRFALAHPRLYRLMHEPDRAPDKDSEEARLALAALSRALGMQTSHPEFIPTMRAVRALVHGFCSLELASQFPWGGDINAAFSRGVRVFQEALDRRIRRRG